MRRRYCRNNVLTFHRKVFAGSRTATGAPSSVYAFYASVYLKNIYRMSDKNRRQKKKIITLWKANNFKICTFFLPSDCEYSTKPPSNMRGYKIVFETVYSTTSRVEYFQLQPNLYAVYVKCRWAERRRRRPRTAELYGPVPTGTLKFPANVLQQTVYCFARRKFISHITITCDSGVILFVCVMLLYATMSFPGAN